MRILNDYSEFRDVTGMVDDAIQLKQDGIDPSGCLGDFFCDRFEELVEFCAENPKYHIISMIKGFAYINKPCVGARLYMLGTGDKSENIVYDCFLDGKYIVTDL